MNNQYILYLDNTGKFDIVNVTTYSKIEVFNLLKDNAACSHPLYGMIMMAKRECEYDPEIWAFQSPLKKSDICAYLEKYKSEMCSAIKLEGRLIFDVKNKKKTTTS